MLRKTDAEIIKSIVEYTPNVVSKTIKVEVAVGSLVDGAFVSDGRGSIFYTIANVPDKASRKSESLTVDAAGQVTLSVAPLDGNPIEVNGTPQDHVTGVLVDCAEYSDGDVVAISYYHTIAGRNWFNEAGAFIQANDETSVGLDDYNYNSKRLWTILIDMGLESGEIF